jgi:hypothetical protein
VIENTPSFDKVTSLQFVNIPVKTQIIDTETIYIKQVAKLLFCIAMYAVVVVSQRQLIWYSSVSQLRKELITTILKALFYLHVEIQETKHS